MKDILIRHPFISLLALDIIVTGVVNCVAIFRGRNIDFMDDSRKEQTSL